MFRRISRNERAILNVVGLAADEYFHQLGHFLNRMPNTNVMELSWGHLKQITVQEDSELAAKHSKVFYELCNC